MKFIASVEIQPSGPFGVPAGDAIVVPGGTSNILSAPLHARSMTKVGHSSLSRFREDSKAVKKNLRIMDLTCVLQDNFLNIKLDASRGKEAYDKIVHSLDRFMKHLTLTTGQLYSFKVLFVEAENGSLYPLPRRVNMMSLVGYDLDRLGSDIDTAEKMSSLSDPVLERALQYYEHSLFLFEKRGQITDILSSHFRYMISEIFLNMWKAASTVIGDPTVDKDYSSRYLRLGIDEEFYRAKVEAARKFRNDYDVAHYRLDLERLEEIEHNFGLVKEVAERVLREYRLYLSEGKPSFARSTSERKSSKNKTANAGLATD